jgi:putative ABC transport system substrate-binding protein
MRRREFITLLGGAAAAWPRAGQAQQQMPVIGFLQAGSPEPNAQRVAAFRKGLSETGFGDQSVVIEFRWAAGQANRLPEMAADLVRRPVDVIATPVSTAAAVAARAATVTIPIVFAVGGDPVKLGLVASLNRPGGNATGISILNVELTSKRLELLHELAPKAVRFGALVNPSSALTDTIVKEVQAGASRLGRQVEVVRAGTADEIEAVFANVSHQPGGALLIPPDEFFFSRRSQLVTLAESHALPTIYPHREAVEAGGLISYGTDELSVYQQVGVYTGRILKGEKPANLPVVQPTKFELVINLKTAKALGLTVPLTLQASADEVIE